ncbi:MAG TPA: wax ester/triacylglycerol synthase domain-containing protein [Streptosporangiaceae bacterium]|nr:wax ester/triacylglycerol synthase domain-containing protein [Streptosporangiaceae bacterium]
MSTRATTADQEAVPDRWRSGLHEVSVGLAVLAVYLVCAHGFAETRRVTDAHGMLLLRFEQWAGIDVEQPLNAFLRQHQTLGAIAAWEYATTYVVGTFGVIVVLWWRRSPVYSWARNTLIFATLIAIACFAMWPTTPPRLLPGQDYTDIVAIHHPPLTWGTGVVSAGADQFAAMPSLHIGWIAWMGAVAIRARAGTLIKVLCVLDLLVTSYVVVATATHYLIDIVGGLLLVPAAVLLERVRVRERARLSERAKARETARRRGGSRLAVPFGLPSGLRPSGLRPAGPSGVRPGGASGVRPGGPSGVRSGAPAAASPDVPPDAPRGGSLPGAFRGRPPRVAAADAFFLYVESAEVPQQVGGIGLLDVSGGAPSIDAVRDLMAERLPRLPRLQQRISPPGAFRRPRWADDPDLDLTWHVRTTTLPEPGGRRALEEFVAGLAGSRLDQSRPLWQLWLVHGVGPGESAVVVLLHHAIADGLGVVDILRNILEPELPPVSGELPKGPGPLARTVFGTAGLVQLALDGTAPATSIGGRMAADRVFRTVSLPLDRVRALAKRAGVRVTDVMLTLVGEVVGEVLLCRGEEADGKALRAAVPITLRPPAPPGQGRSAVAGNRTAGLRLDVPVGPLSARDRLMAVHRSAEHRRRSGRAFASTAVLRGMGLFPVPMQAWAARGTYRARFFGAIVSNMPGPSVEMSFAGVPLREVYPLLPLADGVPLGVGALSWSGRLYISVTAEPNLMPEAYDFDVRLRQAFERLESDVRRHRAERRRGAAVRDRRRLPAARRKSPGA